ncbi:MAG: secondary thiamine-phosphate synthase enzyme YjbQ [Candidatus Thorarchaeota archaeon]
MAVHHEKIRIQTRGHCDMTDITGQVDTVIRNSEIRNGICTVFCVGSTGAVTTIEYEGGLLKDFPEAMERIAPRDAVYEHHLRWGDGNGHSHVRASVVGPSLTIPIEEGRLTLGTWQQLVFVDFDVRPRSRAIHVTILGE